MPGFAEVGRLVWQILANRVAQHEDAFAQLEETLGTEACEGLPEYIIQAARADMSQAFGADYSLEGLQGDIFEQILRKAEDPETEVP